MKKRNRSCHSIEALDRFEEFNRKIDKYDLRKKLTEFAVEDHYSHSMLCDFLRRDYSELVAVLGDLSNSALIARLDKASIPRCDVKKYLALPTEIRIQFKFPKDTPIQEIKDFCRKSSSKGFWMTHKKRSNDLFYNPKNEISYYISQGYDLETSEQMAFLHKARKSPFSIHFCKYDGLSDEVKLEKIAYLARKRGHKGLVSLQNSVCSTLEINFAKQLKASGVEIQQQYFLNPYTYDIFIPKHNVIIEINGTYWHADPRNYQAKEIIKFPYGEKTAQFIWDRDERKNNWAKNRGYQIEVLWEIDIKNDVNGLLIKSLYDKFR